MIRKAIIVVLTLAAVAIGGLWIDSYRFRDPSFFPNSTGWGAFIRVGENGTAVVTVLAGSAGFAYVDAPPPLPLGYEGRTVAVDFEYASRYVGAFGSGVVASGQSTWWVAVRLWIPCLLLAAYPTIAFIRPLRRWRRRRCGLCLECGYNLTGNVSGVCPECGTEIEQP